MLTTDEPTALNENTVDYVRRCFKSDAFLDARLAIAEKHEKTAWPTRNNESFKYTNLQQLFAKTPYVPHFDDKVELGAAPPLPAEFDNAIKVYFKAGKLVRHDALPKGLTIESVATLPADKKQIIWHDKIDAAKHPVASLSQALASDGAYVELAANTTLQQPLVFYYLDAESALQAAQYCYRHHFNIKENAALSLVELAADVSNRQLLNVFTTSYLAQHSQLFYVELNQTAAELSWVNNHHSWQQAGSRLHCFTLAKARGIHRQDIQTYLNGPNASTTLAGSYHLCERAHTDIHLNVDHKASHTHSTQFFKGLADHFARGIFNGKAIIHAETKGCKALQTNRNLLLSDRAEIDTKPELEIYADEVQCSHGATVGQLDAKALFYLRSRGIAEAEAKVMLTRAFLAECLHYFPDVAALQPCLEYVSKHHNNEFM